ncbi:ABC transporter permease [Caldicellulosiruptoraceae bacterium PP1]
MLAVLKKELKLYFSTTTGYIFMGFFLLLSGFFFAVSNVLSASPQYSSTLGSITFIFLIAVPILTMRLITEEAKQKTDQLLLTSPLTLSGIVVGKFLAAVIVFFITLLITCLFPILLSFYGTIALWETVGAYVGFFFLGCSFIAVGLFISSLTENQFVAAVSTFSALLLVWVMDWVKSVLPTDKLAGFIFVLAIVVGIAVWLFFTIRNIFVSVGLGLIGIAVSVFAYFKYSSFYERIIVRFIDWFSLIKRYQEFSIGIFNLSSVVYYLTFCFAFIFLTIRVLEKRRWS